MTLAVLDSQQYAPKKLDIACGQRKREGFTGIDLAGDADIVWDLFQYPWPIKSGSVQHIYISHFVEHIPHYRPDWDKDGWWVFWDEIHRICRKGAKVEVIHPYVRSDRAFWDPTHVRFIHEMTWYYLDPEWRKAQGLDHYDTAADFEVTVVAGTGLANEFLTRSEETKAFAQAHYWNVIPDLTVELRKR